MLIFLAVVLYFSILIGGTFLTVPLYRKWGITDDWQMSSEGWNYDYEDAFSVVCFFHVIPGAIHLWHLLLAMLLMGIAGIPEDNQGLFWQRGLYWVFLTSPILHILLPLIFKWKEYRSYLKWRKKKLENWRQNPPQSEKELQEYISLVLDLPDLIIDMWRWKDPESGIVFKVGKRWYDSIAQSMNFQVYFPSLDRSRGVQIPVSQWQNLRERALIHIREQEGLARLELEQERLRQEERRREREAQAQREQEEERERVQAALRNSILLNNRVENEEPESVEEEQEVDPYWRAL